MPAPIDKFAIWLAGFMDGEGAIMICKFQRHDSKSKSPQYALRLSIVNTELPVLEHIKHEFGGYINNGHGAYSLKNMKFKTFKPVYEWCATDITALKILKRIFPYLLLKKERAELAIHFQESRYLFRKQAGVNNRLSEDEIARREAIYQRMKALNKKGVHPKEKIKWASGSLSSAPSWSSAPFPYSGEPDIPDLME